MKNTADRGLLWFMVAFVALIAGIVTKDKELLLIAGVFAIAGNERD